MRSKKIAFIASLLIAALSIVLYTAFHFYFHIYLIDSANAFIIAIASGFFTSSFVTSIIYFFEYKESKRDDLETFYLMVSKYLKNYKNLAVLDEKSLEYEDDIEFKSILEQYVNIASVDIADIVASMGTIDFLTKAEKERALIYSLYDIIKKASKELAIVSYHFKLYLNGKTNNKAALLHYIIKAQDMLLKKETANGWITYYNNFRFEADTLLEKLRPIMYGKHIKIDLPKFEDYELQSELILDNAAMELPSTI